MTQWKLGYPNDLDAAGSEAIGKALYDSYGVVAITLDSTLMSRAVAQLSSAPVFSSPTTTFTCDHIHVYPSADNAAYPGNTSFATDEFDGGFFRVLNGTAEEEVYEIVDTIHATNTLYVIGDITGDGLANNDYIDMVTGSCSFTFPSGRNPIKWDVKRTYSSKSMRFPYYTGGISVPIGWKEDSIILMAHITTQKDIDRLEVFLSHKLDYEGFCAFSSGNEAAPLIFETASDHNGQYLCSVDDYRIMKDATKGDNFWEVMINLNLYHKILYRGI